MSDLNKAMVIGHLGADPDVRRTQSGAPVASFSVATTERWRDKTTAERRERTTWHRVVIFNEGLCKVAEQYLKKGSKVYVEGAMQTRKWTDKAGVEKYTTEIVLQGFHAQLVMLDRREGVPAAQSPDDYGAQKTSSAQPAASDDIKDEIPF